MQLFTPRFTHVSPQASTSLTASRHRIMNVPTCTTSFMRDNTNVRSQ